MPRGARITVIRITITYEKGVSEMTKGEQLYEGKAKKVFLTDDPDVLIVDYI